MDNLHIEVIRKHMNMILLIKSNLTKFETVVCPLLYIYIYIIATNASSPGTTVVATVMFAKHT